MRSDFMSKKRILMNNRTEKLFSEVWKDFITAKTAKGVSDATILKYHQVLHNLSKYFDIEIPMDKLTMSTVPAQRIMRTNCFCR